jgi:UrcA family protein
MRSHFVLSCPTLACLTLVVPFSPLAATAAESSSYEVATRTVKFADLNLSRPDDVVKLYARIKAAANEVCEPADSRSIDTAVHVRHCKEQAISRAVADAQSSILMAFHMATTNQADAVVNR